MSVQKQVFNSFEPSLYFAPRIDTLKWQLDIQGYISSSQSKQNPDNIVEISIELSFFSLILSFKYRSKFGFPYYAL